MESLIVFAVEAILVGAVPCIWQRSSQARRRAWLANLFLVGLVLSWAIVAWDAYSHNGAISLSSIGLLGFYVSLVYCALTLVVFAVSSVLFPLRPQARDLPAKTI